MFSSTRCFLELPRVRPSAPRLLAGHHHREISLQETNDTFRKKRLPNEKSIARVFLRNYYPPPHEDGRLPTGLGVKELLGKKKDRGGGKGERCRTPGFALTQQK